MTITVDELAVHEADIASPYRTAHWVAAYHARRWKFGEADDAVEVADRRRVTGAILHIVLERGVGPHWGVPRREIERPGQRLARQQRATQDWIGQRLVRSLRLCD